MEFKHVSYLWDDAKAAQITDEVDLFIYRSNLLGADLRLTNFGGGNTSTVVSPPSINYPTTGTFNISLTVTDNNNCPKTVTTQVFINQPFASFYAVGAVNDTVCPTVMFKSQSERI